LACWRSWLFISGRWEPERIRLSSSSFVTIYQLFGNGWSEIDWPTLATEAQGKGSDIESALPDSARRAWYSTNRLGYQISSQQHSLHARVRPFSA
jgi:hypothetical protein